MNAHELMQRIEVAIAEVCAETGAVLLKPIGRVLPDGLALNITVVKGDDAEAIYARYWREQAEFHGVDPDLVGESVRTKRGKAVLLGLHPDGGGAPVILKMQDDSIVMATMTSIREHFDTKQVL